MNQYKANNSLKYMSLIIMLICVVRIVLDFISFYLIPTEAAMNLPAIVSENLHTAFIVTNLLFSVCSIVIFSMLFSIFQQLLKQHILLIKSCKIKVIGWVLILESFLHNVDNSVMASIYSENSAEPFAIAIDTEMLNPLIWGLIALTLAKAFDVARKLKTEQDYTI